MIVVLTVSNSLLLEELINKLENAPFLTELEDYKTKYILEVMGNKDVWAVEAEEAIFPTFGYARGGMLKIVPHSPGEFRIMLDGPQKDIEATLDYLQIPKEKFLARIKKG